MDKYPIALGVHSWEDPLVIASNRKDHIMAKAKTFTPEEVAARYGITGSNPGLTVRKVARSDKPFYGKFQAAPGKPYHFPQSAVSRMAKDKGWKLAAKRKPRKSVAPKGSRPQAGSVTTTEA